MTNPSEISLPVLALKVATLEERQKELVRELSEARKLAEAREKQQLRWGITMLGGIALTLGGVLWNYRGVIFK